MPGSNDLQVLSPATPSGSRRVRRRARSVTGGDDLERLLHRLVLENELVVIDVSEAEFIDSSFLHNLLKADRLARDRGSRLRLQHATKPIVSRALEVSGILTLLDSVSTREDALTPVDRGSPEQRPEGTGMRVSLAEE